MVDDIAIGQLLGVGRRVHAPDRFLWAVLVVVASPTFDLGARVQQYWEPMFVEAFVA